MANAKSHHLIDRSLYFLVREDQQPRDAAHKTIDDDGTERETTHKLYWHVHKDKDGKEIGEVRSMLIEDWTGSAPEEPAEPPPLPFPGASVHFVLDMIERHIAAIVTATPYTDHYAVDLAVFNGGKKRVEWWEGVTYDDSRARVGSWHWADAFFEDRAEPHTAAMVEPGI